MYLAARLSFHQSDAALNELRGLAMSAGNTLGKLAKTYRCYVLL
jgi:hypothetical protein